MSPQLHVPDTVVSYNTRVGRDGQDVVKSIRMILDQHPHTDVLCLQECEGYIEDLRRHFNGGWYVYCRAGWDESRMNPVMVRKSDGYPKRVYNKGWGTIINQAHWTGPVHGLDKPGRTWTWVKVGRLYVVSLHRATDGNGQNKRAYQEEARRLTRFFTAKRADASVLVFGDTNTSMKASHRGSMRDIRSIVQGRLIADLQDPGVDYALTTRNVQAWVKRTKEYGSDHKAVVMRGISVR
jgi:endonuclease/exonuclease/phosphatase family metal-dependent hydrolase